MAENEKVTLDDLPPLGWIQPARTARWAVCTRCGCPIYDNVNYGPVSGRMAHERWHAAIEDAANPRLSTLRRAELDRLVSQATSAAAPVQQGGGGGDTGDELQPLRDQLIERFNLVDDGDAGYGGDWLIDHLMKVIEPHVEQQVEQYADKAEACDRLHAGLSRGETDRLRRVEDALVAAGAPNRSEPGDPGGLQVAWISQQQDLIKELRKQVESLSQASQEQRRDLRAVLGMGVDTTWSQMIRLIGQQRDYVALLERKSRDCTEKHTPVFEPPSCVKHREFIDRVWQIALEAGHKSGSSVTDWIEQQLAELAEHRKHDCPPIPGHDRPLTEQELAEIYQASGWGTAEQAAEWAKGEPCPSLYLHNGELLTCTVTDRSGHTAHYSGQNDTVTGHEIAWGTSEAVPVPWPLDQEPPAGINTLRDTGAGETLSYLCRATRTWVWSDKPALPHGPYKLLPWAEAVLDADGDLHVVRP